MAPSTRDFLFDSDATLARAAERVIVTAERIVPSAEIRDGDALLFSFEVDAVVELAHGAWPSGLPGVYGADIDAVRTYLAAAESDADAAAVTL